MISSIISRIVILVFGTLYPAYASYKAVRTKNVKEYVKWMMYWIVFALFTCAETVTDVFFSWFPFYYEVKIILVLWLLSPATKGSSILYRKFVHPALCRREQEIDEYISKAKDQGYHTVLNLGTKGVNYATNVIMQTAIKNFGAQQSVVDSPTPSARQPLSSVSNRRDVQIMEQSLYRSAHGDGNHLYSPDEVDLTRDDDVIMERDPIANLVYDPDVSIPSSDISPVRRQRKVKAVAAPKRSRSNSRKTRKQTAMEKKTKTQIKRDVSSE